MDQPSTSRETVVHHKCPNIGCGRVYRQLRDLNRHLKYQCGKPERFKCAYCDFKSYFSSSARGHVKRMHPTKDIAVINLQVPTDETDLNQFQCANCNKRYKSKDSLRQHINFVCGKEKTFKCKYCPYKAHLNSYVVTHIKNMHKDQEIRVVRHGQLDVSNKPVKRFPCPNEGCTHVYVRRSGLLSHLKYMCGNKKYFKCPKCPYKAYFASKVTMHAHNVHQLKDCKAIDLRPEDMKTTKSTVKPHKCPNANCDKAYQNRRNLRVHLQYYCGKTPGFKCQHCPYAAYTSAILAGHIEASHKGQENSTINIISPFDKSIPDHVRKKYKCPIPKCTVAFEHKGQLLKHLKYGCPTALSYKCPYCPLKSLFRRRIHDHIKISHAKLISRVVNLVIPEESVDPNKKEYQCPKSYCGQRYRHKQSLTEHLKQGCYETPFFRCKYCPYKDFHPVFICEHIKQMHAGKPARVINLRKLKREREKNKARYQCPNNGCSCVYKNKQTLVTHLTYICGKPPRFGCPHCSYKYFRRDKVRVHMEKKHKDMDGDVIEFKEN